MFVILRLGNLFIASNSCEPSEELNRDLIVFIAKIKFIVATFDVGNRVTRLEIYKTKLVLAIRQIDRWKIFRRGHVTPAR